MSVNRYTLTHIKGTSLEALFSEWWGIRFPRDGNGTVFLDVNPKCFESVVDYLIKRNIAPPDSPLEMPYKA